MLQKLSITALIGLLSSAASFANADCTYSGGNYYCAQTDAIVYSNVGLSATYQDVTNMDESSCSCTQADFTSSGSLAPFNEELSVHFRGPIELLQFGVYYPNGESKALKKRSEAQLIESCNEQGEAVVSRHKHQHRRDVAVEYVQVTSTVYVDGSGETVTADSTNTVVGPAVPSAYTQVSTVLSNTAQTTETGASPSSASSSKTTTTTSSSAAAAASSSSSSNTNGDWSRGSYFVPGSTSNCTFMNSQGGSAGSGVWSSCFGNSISFAASDGTSGAASPQALGDVTLASGNEFMIFSGDECSGNNAECGYYREGIPAYRGFGGADKIFVFEFSMPSDTSGSAYNQDMPAIWLLNAKIPRTLQYGDASCSCWKTGCGEMDLFEILTANSDKLISHIHDGQDGGTQDYFNRPTDGSLKAAVIFNSSDETIHIIEVDESFDESLSDDVVDQWLSKAGSSAALP
ncbi:target of Sbf [Saccharomyces pastorianus]|uniref:glucan endo-1,3-beta-D-glucosidase n=1 Tax=Saccharomyces pastorianus TaxID=27292 RepID=A0A6C1E4R0_SACPS|nr:target of Sbf [Saccharomyces pastorianus]